MRRLLIGIYVLFCGGILLLLLGAGYWALPVVTEWDCDDAKLAELTHQELTNDYWRGDPSPDRELLAIRRNEYTLQKPILPGLIRPTWGYYVYVRYRIRDEQLRDRLLSAPQSSDHPPHAFQRERGDEPLPDWWHPKYFASLGERDDHVYFFDPAEPDIACTMQHYEGTLPN